MRLLLGLILLFGGNALAQEGTAATGPCASDPHRQFDFWVGTWEVTSGGQPAGSNRIELIHGGCALAEHWTSAQQGFSGSSLNTYDKSSGRWHQTWVDTQGTLLLLDGGMVDGRMVMEGTQAGADGATVSQRITWTRNEDGSVRQHWESRTDGGDWTTVFDGLYHKAGSKP